jgi:hypothetical protein
MHAKAISERQSPVYFRLCGGRLKGICLPGAVARSCVFVEDCKLHADIGRATAIDHPAHETMRRRKETISPKPIMRTALHGVTRDQLIERHYANHAKEA